ncbi:MAG: hypothetical protein LBD58_11465 [Treponema sp.]|jgi:hypothetical protein|nr:hypothetical protein [Treponema sp.]
MKISIKMTLSAFLLALVFFFAGCQDGSDAAFAPQKGASAKIVVSVDGAGGAARTVGPDAANVSYRLVVTNSYDETEKYESDIAGATVTRELKAGEWQVGVWAYTGESLGVGWADETVTLAEGETKNVSLVVQPLTTEESAGTFSWGITLPAGDETSSTSATATLASDSAISINLNDFSEFNEAGTVSNGSLELPAGKYTLDVTATSTRKIYNASLKAARKEIVYIYPRLTTNASFAFTAADFSAEVYFSGTAALSYPTYAPTYTPVDVELELEDGSVQSAPITLNEDNYNYEWELSALSNAINTGNLTNASFRFKAELGGKSLYSPWQTASLSNVTGKTGIQLSAAIYKVTVPAYAGGSIEADNSEVVNGGSTRLTIKPDSGYGFDATGLPYGAQPVDDANGIQYDITIQNGDPSFAANVFFQPKGTVVLSGANAAQYKPIKIEAFESAVTGKQIGTTETFGDAAGKYPWTIAADSYVYTTSYTKNIVLRVTLEKAGDGTTSSANYTTDISNLYGTKEAAVTITVP